MLVDVSVVQVMKMAVVQVVDVIAVTHACVTAVLTVYVIVSLVCVVAHRDPAFWLRVRMHVRGLHE